MRSPPASASSIRSAISFRASPSAKISCSSASTAGSSRPIDYDAVHAEARRWLEVLELDLDPRTPVSQLNVAKVQLVEIAKALSLRSRVLLLDEPTASLTPQEAEVLFRLLRKLRDEGASLLFVSHKLEEVQQICDEVTVLRDGRNACPSQPMAGLGAPGSCAPDDRPKRADTGLGADAITALPRRCWP